jgi:hypothetical protein
LLTIRVISRPARLYQYPYLVGFAFTSVLLPQAFSLVAGDSFALQQSSDLFLMCFLCVCCAWVGYQIVPRKVLVPAWLERSLTSAQLYWGSLVLIVIGGSFTFMFGALGENVEKGTGIATIFLFFANWIYVGVGLSIYGAIKYRKVRFWISSAAASVVPIQAALLYARREPTVLFLLSVAFSVFFLRRIALPRALIVCSVLTVVIFMPMTTAYRSAASRSLAEAISVIDLSDPLKGYREGTEYAEMRAALYAISDAREDGQYAHGAGYWDELVFRFIPAQILGEDFKKSLFLGERIKELDINKYAAREISVGTTITGAGDAFQQFGFLGALFFAVMGYLFRGLWAVVRDRPSPLMHAFYANVAVTAMHTVTHGTADFLPGVIYTTLALGVLSLLTPLPLTRLDFRHLTRRCSTRRIDAVAAIEEHAAGN